MSIRQIPVGLDPSVTGLAGEVGERVVAADGSAIWDKTGPGVTDWQAPGSSGVTFPPTAGPSLTDADQTINPGSTYGQYTMPAGTLTDDRTIVVGETAGVSGLLCWVNILAQDFDVVLSNDVGEVFTVPAGKRYSVAFLFGGLHWNLSYAVAIST